MKRAGRRRFGGEGPRVLAGYAIAIAGPAVVTAGLLAVRGDVTPTNVALAYLLVVVAAAANGGLWPGMTGAALGFLAFDLLFLPPYGHLEVNSQQDYVSLAVYLLIALVVSVLVDARERRRVEAERREHEASTRALVETDRLRTALLNSVSHDLRTPLSSIKASASSLLDPDIDWDRAEQREFLETIDQESDRLSRLVHNLLDMSRIEAGGLDPQLVETTPAEVVGPVVRLARAQGGQRVLVDLHEDLPAILVDPVRLDQVLTNLVDNARRHAPGGSVTITGQARDGRVELRVIDHGPGVPEPERERIFGQFYRLRRNGRGGEGTGMGLAICRGIVSALGGRISVESTPGGGATFVVSLPAADQGAR